jgi:signal transduction histidine kinase
MRNFVPASLFARMVLILLGGMVLSQVLSIAIFVREHDDMMLNVQTEQAARRVVDLARVFEETAVSERSRLAAAVSSRGFRVRLAALPAERPANDPGENLDELRHSLEIAFADQKTRLQSLALVEPSREEFSRRPRSPQWDLGATLAGQPRIGNMPKSIRVALSLEDGAPLSFDLMLPRFAPRPTLLKVITELALRIAVLLLVCLLAVRLAMRPVRDLGRAARELGENLNAPPMKETGSEEIRAAARAFNQMQRKLQNFLSERTRMLAAVSHDLKTPITRMRLRSEQIADETLQEKFVQDLGEMEQLVAGTLAFMRNLEVERTARLPLDLPAMIESIIADREDSGFAIVLSGSAPEPISAYPQSIKRCIENLLDNALKYGSDIRVTLSQTPSTTCVIVSDRGPGIAEAELGKVFEPFYRVEASRNRDTGGSGLGLSISQNIAHAHGGEVVLRNLHPHGLEATLLLPRQ